LDEGVTVWFPMREIAKETILYHFARNLKIHRIWEARHRPITSKTNP